MDKFVPGPWEVCKEPANEYWHSGVTIGAAKDSDARRVCDVWTGGAKGDDISPIYAANARLIAASPILLQAARFALLNYLRNLNSEEECGKPFMGDDEHEAIKLLSEAISLAT